MSELLPCPFCGGEAKTVLADTYPHRGMLHSWFVACKDSECGCELGFYGMDENGTCGTYETEDEAIDTWNTRYHSEFEKTVIKAWKEIQEYQERTCEIYRIGNTLDLRKCSACDALISFSHPLDRCHLNYCPNCGAKVTPKLLRNYSEGGGAMSEYIYASNGEPLTNARGEVALARHEIVRCRDCRLCDERYGRLLCRRDMSCDEIALDVEPDGFCAWGVRDDA